MKKRFLLIAPDVHKRLRIMAANRDVTMNSLAADLINQLWDSENKPVTNPGTRSTNGQKTNEKTLPTNRR